MLGVQRLTGALLTLSLLAPAGCGDAVSAGGDGVTRVLLTDAPFPFDQVSRVDVHIVSIAATANFDTSTAVEWTTLVEPARTFNLLDLQNGATALLGETRVPAGQYGAVRMEIRTDLSSITMADGSPAAVDWEGPATQVLHALVEQPLSIGDGGADLIIDFDVGRSFVSRGGAATDSGTPSPLEFLFLPWFRAVNQAATGTIVGAVYGDLDGGGIAEPIGSANVTVYRSAGPGLILAATGRADAEGRFAIHYVSGGGPYLVEAAPPSGVALAYGYSEEVYVTPGEETGVGIVLGQGAPGGQDRRLVISGPSQVRVGETITLFAFVFNENGDSVFGAPVTWQQSDPAVAQLVGSGYAVQLTGLAVGVTSVVATSNELLDSLVVTVGEAGAPVASVEIVPASLTLAVGDSTGLNAVLRDAVGNVLTGRQVSWSLDSSVVNPLYIYNDLLIVRAVAPGSTVIRAIAEGKEGSATVTVN